MGALAAVGCGRPPLPASAPSHLLGRPLPKIDQRSMDARPIDPAVLAGRTVVVKFFAQYCEPCTRTLPAAQRLSKDRPDVIVVGVAEDEQESVVRELLSTYELTFPVIHDRNRVLAGRFRVTELPATFVAGPDGAIRWVGGPEQRPSDLEQAVGAVAP